jgi:tryptophan-rich sensory protein
MTGLLVAAVLANLADFATFLRVKPALIAAHETSPLPQLLGQTGGALAAKLIVAVGVAVTVVAFRRRPRTRAALLGIYTVWAVVGAASNVLVGW